MNSTLTEVITTIKKKKDLDQYLPLMVSAPHTHTSKKFCLFHKDKKHDMEDHLTLNKEIERLIAKGYLK